MGGPKFWEATRRVLLLVASLRQVFGKGQQLLRPFKLRCGNLHPESGKLSPLPCQITVSGEAQ